MIAKSHHGLFVLAFLFFTPFSFGQAVSAVPVGTNQAGVPTQVQVTICATNPGNGTCNSLVTTYTDITLGTSCTGSGGPLNGSNCSNPGHTDVFGNVVAFANSGFYWCQFSGSTTSPYSVPCPSNGGGSEGSTAFSSITAGTNTAALVEGTGGSLTPSGTGQIISNGSWLNSSSPVVSPSPAGADSCATGLNPVSFVQDASGNWEPSAGIDPTTAWAGYSTIGWLAFCRPVEFISGARLPNYPPNGAMTVFKTPSAVVNPADTTAMQVQNNMVSSDTGSYTGQVLGIYAETDTGSATSNAEAIAGQVSFGGLRGVISDLRTSNGTASMFGVSGAYFKNANGGTTSGDNGGFFGWCGVTVAVSVSSGTCDSFFAAGSNTGAATNGIYVGFHATPPATAYPTAQYGLLINGPFPSTANNFNIRSDGNPSTGTGKNLFNGEIYAGAIGPSAGAIPVTGSFVLGNGSLNTTQLSNPTGSGYFGLTNQGTAGSTSYTYNITLCDGAGFCTKPPNATTTTTGNATLDSTNFNQITMVAGNQGFGTASINIYRTASSGTPSSTGLIGNVLVTQNSLGTLNPIVFKDTGLAGDGTSVPVQNLTGSVNAPLFSTKTNCSSGANPAVCGSAAAGAVAVPTGATPTLVIDTTAVTALSEIELTVDGSLTISGVTCNTTLATLVNPVVIARTPGTSFTITINSTLAVNPGCVSYSIIN